MAWAPRVCFFERVEQRDARASDGAETGITEEERVGGEIEGAAEHGLAVYPIRRNHSRYGLRRI